MSNGSPLRLAFVGVGWIGRNRMQALLDVGLAEAVAIVEPDEESRRQAQALAPTAATFDSLQALLEADLPLDGVVLATPSAAHAAQSIAVLQHGLPVFCQKPLGRHADEVAAVLHQAQAADRLLGVDLSYRHLAGMAALRQRIRAGELGHVYAMDLVFHNAYGPDKPWFYQRELSGGGCVIDLGIHLVDLALWLLDFPAVERVASRCFSGGQSLHLKPEAVEDYAIAQLELSGDAVLDLACSWNLALGTDAEIGLRVHGTGGGAGLRNLDGSFYDFVLERFHGRQREILAGPPDAWGGRAAVAWARALVESKQYDGSARELLTVTRVLDAIYASARAVRPAAAVPQAAGAAPGGS